MLYIRLVKFTRMKFLLPHRYKRIGAVMAPLGFTLWLLMQFGYVKRVLASIFGQPNAGYAGPPLHTINVLAAVAGFFCFLGGMYFVTFSKEKVEDEMVQKTRRDSFQFAAFVQILVTVAGFLFVLLAGDPGEGGLMLFLVALVVLFWLSFIGRFNYVLHLKYRG